MILFLVIFCVVVALGFAIAAAASDYRTMQIPNLYAGAIVLAFIPAYATDALTGNGLEYFFSWKSHLLAGVLVFVITLGLFAARIIGAGDSKLCSAVALWVATPGIAPFLFYMALAGALLGIATKVMNKRQLIANAQPESWPAQAQAGKQSVPYGIAIMIGMMVAFYQLGYFSPEKMALLAGFVATE